MLITASYRQQEFVRVGYYVNNEYEDQEMKDNPPAEPQFDKLVRQIAADQPRVTKFKINWDPASSTEAANECTAAQDTEMIEETSNNAILKNTDLSQEKTNVNVNEGLVFEQ